MAYSATYIEKMACPTNDFINDIPSMAKFGISYITGGKGTDIFSSVCEMVPEVSRSM